MKQRTTLPLALVALIALLAAGPVSAQGITDQDVTLAVDTELILDDATPSHLIDVETTDGVVTLSGVVDNLLAKRRAADIAETVKGVRSVVNDVDVVPPIARSDKEVQESVNAALIRDPATESYEVKAAVDDGKVALTGAVESWREKMLAEQVAAGVDGVTGVENDIDVEYKAQRTDSEIAADVRGALERDVWVDEDLIAVSVDDGAVELAGRVGSAAEKSHAYTDAWVTGVASVDHEDVEVDPALKDGMQKSEKKKIVSDAKIRQSVKDALLFDPRVSAFEPVVIVEDGVVTLTGTVDNLKAKRAAERDAMNTTGVIRVKNHLKVRPDTRPSDAVLAQRVREAIERSPMLDRADIRVTASSGKVFLNGEVDTFFERDQAEDAASRVQGVIEVQNRIQVAPEEDMASDWEIREDVQSQLFWSPFVDSGEVQVSVDDGVATLTGEVDSYFERRQATKNAFDAGAAAVDNNLSVQNPSGVIP
jgi:osmotically-inducible protein OsmY